MERTEILSVRVRRRAGRDHVAAHGELDIATQSRLRAALADARLEQRAVELDLSGLAFCDAVGARLLADAARAAARAGLAFRVHGLHGEVARVLRLLRVRLPAD